MVLIPRSNNYYICMLGAKYGYAQSVDPYIARQSIDYAAQTTDCLVRSQVQSKDKLRTGLRCSAN